MNTESQMQAGLLVVWLTGPVLGRLYAFVNAFTLPKLTSLVARELFNYIL